MQSVLSLTPEDVVGMSPMELRKLAAKEIQHLLAEYRKAGRARSWPGMLVFGLVLSHLFGSAKDIGSGCLNILLPFLGLGYLLSGSFILWVLQLVLCLGLPLLLWPGYEQLGYAIGGSYAMGLLFNLLSFFVLKKISVVLRWLRLVRKVRCGLAGLHAGTRELVRPFFAKEREYASFCAELDTREAQYRLLLASLQPHSREAK